MERLEEILNEDNLNNINVSEVMNLVKDKVQKQRNEIDYYFKSCMEVIKLISQDDNMCQVNSNLQQANLSFNPRNKPHLDKPTESEELQHEMQKSLNKINRWFYDYPLTDTSLKNRLRKMLKKTIRPFLLYQNAFNVHFTRLLNNFITLYDTEIADNTHYNAYIVRTLNSLVSKVLNSEKLIIEWTDDLSRAIHKWLEDNKEEVLVEMQKEYNDIQNTINKEIEERNEALTNSNKSIEEIHNTIKSFNNRMDEEFGRFNRINEILESTINQINTHKTDISEIHQQLDKNIQERIKEYRNLQLTIKSIQNKLLEQKETVSHPDKKTQRTQDTIIDHYQNIPNFDFYAFEEWARGSEESVVSQQESYVEFFKGRNNILDVGCGRGEFLELLRKSDIEAYGIDTDINMIEHCKEKNLKVLKIDILSHLKSLDNDSLGGIFAGQLIEHLSTTDLITLIELAYDKLKPDSPIILETVNPTNLTTFSGSFYADPTHIKPIHPVTLEFFIEKAGFRDFNLHFSVPFPEEGRLKECDIPDNNNEHKKDFFITYNENVRKLNQILFGYANYAIIAYK